MKPKALLPTLLIVAAFGLAACGGGDETTVTETETAPESKSESDSDGSVAPGGEAVRSAKVEIEGFSYDPDPVTIAAGGKVTWINRDSAPHTATADDGSFDTGTLDQGKLGSESFKEPGTFEYICSIHPDMHGTVEVVED